MLIALQIDEMYVYVCDTIQGNVRGKLSGREDQEHKNCERKLKQTNTCILILCEWWVSN